MSAPAADRPMHPPGAEIAAQAWDAFDQWLETRVPDGREFDLYELALEYPGPWRG